MDKADWIMKNNTLGHQSYAFTGYAPLDTDQDHQHASSQQLDPVSMIGWSTFSHGILVFLCFATVNVFTNPICYSAWL